MTSKTVCKNHQPSVLWLTVPMQTKLMRCGKYFTTTETVALDCFENFLANLTLLRDFPTADAIRHGTDTVRSLLTLSSPVSFCDRFLHTQEKFHFPEAKLRFVTSFCFSDHQRMSKCQRESVSQRKGVPGEVIISPLSGCTGFILSVRSSVHCESVILQKRLDWFSWIVWVGVLRTWGSSKYTSSAAEEFAVLFRFFWIQPSFPF